MPTRFAAWQKQRRIEAGAQFLVAGPVIDPATVGPSVERLGLSDDDPPLFLMMIPPFGSDWVARMESMGAVPATDELRTRLAEAEAESRRAFAWESARRIAEEAAQAGCAGAILMGLRFDTIVDEAALEWRQRRDLGELGGQVVDRS